MATTFAVFDCNQNGTYSSQPFSRTSTCAVANGHDPVSTNSYVSYSAMGS
jgi:hypothetical protein